MKKHHRQFPKRSAALVVVACASLFPLARPAVAAPLPFTAFAAPTNVGYASTAAQCEAALADPVDRDACVSAIQKHLIVLVWQFDSGCTTATACANFDGFRIVGGTGAVIQTAGVRDRAAILQTTGAQNIGQCFSVMPYSGPKNGPRAQPMCIGETLNISGSRSTTAHNYAYNDGTNCKSPSSNPAGFRLLGFGAQGKGLISGYVNREGGTSTASYVAAGVLAAVDVPAGIAAGSALPVGDVLGCNSYVDVFQGLTYFDLSGAMGSLAGKTVTDVKLHLRVISAAANGGDPTQAANDGNEVTSDTHCPVQIGIPTNADVATQAVFPKSIAWGTSLGSIDASPGDYTVDLFGLVPWLQPGAPNVGLVLTPTSVGTGGYVNNSECIVQFYEPTLSISVI